MKNLIFTEGFKKGNIDIDKIYLYSVEHKGWLRDIHYPLEIINFFFNHKISKYKKGENFVAGTQPLKVLIYY